MFRWLIGVWLSQLRWTQSVVTWPLQAWLFQLWTWFWSLPGHLSFWSLIQIWSTALFNVFIPDVIISSFPSVTLVSKCDSGERQSFLNFLLFALGVCNQTRGGEVAGMRGGTILTQTHEWIWKWCYSECRVANDLSITQHGPIKTSSFLLSAPSLFLVLCTQKLELALFIYNSENNMLIF